MQTAELTQYNQYKSTLLDISHAKSFFKFIYQKINLTINSLLISPALINSYTCSCIALYCRRRNRNKTCIIAECVVVKWSKAMMNLCSTILHGKLMVSRQTTNKNICILQCLLHQLDYIRLDLTQTHCTSNRRHHHLLSLHRPVCVDIQQNRSSCCTKVKMAQYQY